MPPPPPPPSPPLFLATTAFLIILAATPTTCRLQETTLTNHHSMNGMFVFGSSLVDIGNNEYLPGALSTAKYPPYGVDFPAGATGRYTNGKNFVDVLSENLNLIPPLSSLDPEAAGEEIYHGVDFASGGSGILDDTGSVTGQVINFNQQMRDFEETVLPKLENFTGYSRKEILPKYLILVGVGGNDYTLNYFLNLTDPRPSLNYFTSDLISSLSAKVQHIQSLGAKKFVLMSLYPLGCSPTVLVRNPATGTTTCSEPLNQAAQLFNTKLKSMVDDLNKKLTCSKFVLVNSYGIVDGILSNPSLAGFRDTSNSCCESTTILCNRGGKVCEDRKGYVYFDGLHPTEAVNIQIGTKAYNSSSIEDVYPINVKQLVQM
ncbi:GDSL esterase/lipase At1g29670 [Linum grandiflorum]